MSKLRILVVSLFTVTAALTLFATAFSPESASSEQAVALFEGAAAEMELLELDEGRLEFSLIGPCAICFQFTGNVCLNPSTDLGRRCGVDGRCTCKWCGSDFTCQPF